MCDIFSTNRWWIDEIGIVCAWECVSIGELVVPCPKETFMRHGSGLLALTLMLTLLLGSPGRAQAPSLEQLLSGIVHIKTYITPDGNTAENLGREREGTGVVIDSNGLVLTIGYLMVEAVSAEITTNDGHTVPANVVGYDNETGFGLLRATAPLKVRPLVLGKSSEVKENDPMIVASSGGAIEALPVHVVSVREFPAEWEYMLEKAIFTAPPHPTWSGAALLDHEGKLLGIGSLRVPDVTGKGDNRRGNMFVPIDLLQPILGDLLAQGHTSDAHPWLGLNTNDVGGHLVISRVTPESPAEKAGLRRGDIILGVDGETSKGLPDFYRKIWAHGPPGTNVPLDVLHNHERMRVDVHSINRLDMLKLHSSF
jgi:serine protease Do